MRLGKRLAVLGVAIPSPMDVVGHDVEPINILDHIYYIKTAKIPLQSTVSTVKLIRMARNDSHGKGQTDNMSLGSSR